MNRKLAHGIGAAFVMALLAAVLSVGASASETMQKVMYLDENGVEKTTTATVVESLPDDAEDQNVTWTDGWYVVADEVTIRGNVTVEGNVNLILSLRSYLGIEGSVFDGSVDGQQGHLNIYAQHISGENAYHGWEASAIGHLELTGNEESSCIYVNTGLYGGCIDGKISAASLHVHHGFLNANRPFSSIYPGTFAISGGYAAVNLECSKATISGGTVEGKISSGEVEITGGTINSSEYEPYVIESTGDIKIFGGEINGGVCANDNGKVTIIGGIICPSESGGDEIVSGGDITISGGEINGKVRSMDSLVVEGGTIKTDEWSRAILGARDVTITGGTIVGEVHSEGTITIDGEDAEVQGGVSAGNTVNLKAGKIGEVLFYSDVYHLVVNIVGGTVTGDVTGSEIYVGDKENGTLPMVRGNISVRGEEVDFVSIAFGVGVYSGTVVGSINTPRFFMEGGEVRGNVQVESYGGWMDDGTCSSLTLQGRATFNINGGTIQRLYTSSSVAVNAGSIGTLTGGGDHAVVYDNTAGKALPEDFVPKQMLYLSYDKVNEAVTGFADGNLSFPEDFSITAPSEWEDQAQMEVTILPGATVTVPWMFYKGTLLVEGEFLGRDADGPVVYGTTPYYAINADAETVSGVSATGAIVRDGVTFAQPDALVTLTPKESGAVRWAVEPATLTVQNNKFYMPDEVVDIKASKLPLEDTPKLGIDSKGENLTGLTVGAYYSISDAIFRPSKTTLPIRPEWYGTTVTIIKLGDGFATADSFAQSLAIPAKSSGGGTVTPTPTPGGDDSGWEQVEEEITEAKPGATVTVEDPDIPGEVLEALAGEDVTLRVEVNSSLSWEIKGENLKISASYSDLDLAVTWKSQGIPAHLLSPLLGRETVQFSVKHDGEFGFPAALVTDLGRANAGRWANLYHYNEKDGAMEFEAAVQIGAEGKARLPMSHASQHAVVIHEKSHQLPFTDIPNSWYTEAVRYVYTHNMMAGTSGTTFVPTKSLTRAEVAQVLYNIEDQPEVNGTTSFADSAAHWAKTPIAWAEQIGVVDGYEDGTFRPDQPVTREEFAQMLYDYAAYKGYDLTAEGDLSAFPDGDQVQKWALPAMTWANGNALINGHDDGTLEPGGTTTRAQAASILMRFDQKLVEE